MVRAFILYYLILSGCQSVPTLNSQERKPTSIEQCQDIFSTSRLTIERNGGRGPLSTALENVSEQELRTFFENLTDYGVPPWTLIEQTERAYKAPIVAADGRSIFLGKSLLKRRDQQESTAVILTSLGWRERLGYLMPPQNLGRLLKKTYERLLERAEANGVSESDLILPAFPFRKGSDIRYVRLGIDTLPPKGEGWQLTNVGEIPVDAFDDLILEGKMLIDPEMFYHDFGGHLVDYIERPKYMTAIKRYLDQKRRATWPEGKARRDLRIPKDERIKLYGMIELREGFERYLNELLFLPLPEMSKQIESVLGPATNEMTLDNLRQKYERMNQADLVKTANRYVRNQNILYSRHGGGARDFNYERYTTTQNNLVALDEMMSGQSVYRHDQPGFATSGNRAETDQAYKRLELPGYFERIELLASALRNAKVPDAFAQKLEALSSSKEQAARDQTISKLLASHLAEVEFRVRHALELGVTPEKIANDLADLYQPHGWEHYRKSATYRYYKVTSIPNSVQWYYLVDVARAAE